MPYQTIKEKVIRAFHIIGITDKTDIERMTNSLPVIPGHDDIDQGVKFEKLNTSYPNQEELASALLALKKLGACVKSDTSLYESLISVEVCSHEYLMNVEKAIKELTTLGVRFSHDDLFYHILLNAPSELINLLGNTIRAINLSGASLINERELYVEVKLAFEYERFHGPIRKPTLYDYCNRLDILNNAGFNIKQEL